MSPSDSQCNIREGCCICIIGTGHDGPHVCACGGSWDFIGDRFVLIAWPGSNEEFREVERWTKVDCSQ